MNWISCDGDLLSVLDMILERWLGPEFVSFVHENVYWVLPHEVQRDWLIGFGVDLVFGEADDWDEVGEWVDSKEYRWIFGITIPPHRWSGKIIPSEIISEMRRGKGEMPDHDTKVFRDNFFRCVYE